MLIAQISDPHVSTPDSDNDRLLRTPSHLERAVAHLNAHGPRPDITLVTGDLVERGGLDEYRRLRTFLDRLEMPFLVIPGNHDARGTLRQAFADHAYLPREGEFLHYVVEEWPVRLVGLDTVVPGSPGGAQCPARLAWLDARLAEAPDRPTLIFMHHPPFVTGLAAMDEMGLDGQRGFADVLRRHPQVERVVCGHVHRPITRRLAGTVVMTCPSTAHQIALALAPVNRLGVVMEPPTCLMHAWLGPEHGLVTHESVIGNRYPAFVVQQDGAWLDHPKPPPGFHPAG